MSLDDLKTEFKTRSHHIRRSRQLWKRYFREASQALVPDSSYEGWRKRSQFFDDWKTALPEEERSLLYYGDYGKARTTHVAASLLRGTRYEHVERTCKEPPQWGHVRELLSEHGNPNKLSVVVKSDLTPTQQAVQAGHAVAEWLLHGLLIRRGNWQGWWNGRLVYLDGGANDLWELSRRVEGERRRMLGNFSTSLGSSPVDFYEDGGELKHQLTAFAVLGNYETLKDLKLLDLNESRSSPEKVVQKGLLQRVVDAVS